MHIFFRVDASLTAGVGHVMRCLTLAGELRNSGATVSFISRENSGNFCDLIEEKGFLLYRLSAPSARDAVFESFPVHASWLGAPWLDDARQTLAILTAQAEKPAWLVVDHYAIDQRWEYLVAPAVTRLMVIDDLADRFHQCDLLLDQNLVAGFETRYAGKVPSTCGLLLGPKYALLQNDYLKQRKRSVVSRDAVRRIFVFFGGADRENLTARSISAFLTLDRPEIELDVVLGTSHPYADAIRLLVEGHKNIHLHRNLSSLATLMGQADLAMGAGGTASWERLCLGLPTLVVTLADNQRPIAAELHQRKLILWLGDQDEVDESVFASALRELIEGWPQNHLHSGSEYVDGLGARRVCTAMCIDSSTVLRVRRANFADEFLLLEWANDPATRANAFTSSHITPQAHARWFQGYMQNTKDCHLYIVETDEGDPIGQVRFEYAKDAWTVDYSLAPVLRGRGLGNHLLNAALLQLDAEVRDVRDALVIGKVKSGNLASRKVFESLGFLAEHDGAGHVKYTRRSQSF
jgi:UDP-2,4-diacetamido-2,4,6-trideoxy-beta-L-altropyranose hydrolase